MTPTGFSKLEPALIRRLLGTIEGAGKDRHAVYFAGIHGNEPAGIVALDRVMNTIRNQKIPFFGKFWAVEGNLPALRQNIRFVDKDLNRIWFTEINDEKKLSDDLEEVRQKNEIIDEIKNIMSEVETEVFFFDLHTTSSQSIPFLSISDTLRNREIVENIPVPLILGLEEQMEGTLFNFFSELGISMLLFEAGQHSLVSSVDCHEAFIWLTLVELGFIKSKDFPVVEFYELLAKEDVYDKHIFELNYKYTLEKDLDFTMIPGFVNFQKVKKGQVLAHESGLPVKARNTGRVFMPLYQKQGLEGFFIISEVSKFWLKVSEVIRKMKLDKFMNLLPGVKRFGKGQEAFIIHPYVAKVTITSIFHLLGFRKVTRHDNRFIVKRRPYDWNKPTLNSIKRGFEKMIS